MCVNSRQVIEEHFCPVVGGKVAEVAHGGRQVAVEFGDKTCLIHFDPIFRVGTNGRWIQVVLGTGNTFVCRDHDGQFFVGRYGSGGEEMIRTMQHYKLKVSGADSIPIVLHAAAEFVKTWAEGKA